MKMDPNIKMRMDQVSALMESIVIGEEFWDINNRVWQDVNNHTMRTLRMRYHDQEKDPEIKKIFGAMVDKMVWLYVNYTEWRARISWMVWFLQLYSIDKQFNKEKIEFIPEIWCDPRRWKEATDIDNGISVKVDQMDTSH
jgi:hypothetical protein